MILFSSHSVTFYVRWPCSIEASSGSSQTETRPKDLLHNSCSHLFALENRMPKKSSKKNTTNSRSYLVYIRSNVRQPRQYSSTSQVVKKFDKEIISKQILSWIAFGKKPFTKALFRNYFFYESQRKCFGDNFFCTTVSKAKRRT